MDLKEYYKEGMSEEEFTATVEKLLQSETDKVRTDYSTKLKDLESKVPVEKSPESLALEERIKAIEEKERQYQIVDMLTEKNLPKGLSKYLTVNEDDFESFGNDMEELLGNMISNNSFTPTNHRKTESVVTKDSFRKMTYLEREKFSSDHPELYTEFTK